MLSMVWQVDFIGIENITSSSLMEVLYETRRHNKLFSSVGGGSSGIATGGSREAEYTPDSKKFAKNQEKGDKIQEKMGKKRKIEKVLSLCPSWQIGLARGGRWALGAYKSEKFSPFCDHFK